MSKILPYVWKKYRKSEAHLCLVIHSHSFTKLSKNGCLIHIHILVSQYIRSDCNLWNTLILLHFWKFSYIFDVHSSPSFYRLCVWLMNKFGMSTYQMWPQVLLFNCISLGFFIYYYLHVWNNVTTLSNFYKLCVKAEE